MRKDSVNWPAELRAPISLGDLQQKISRQQTPEDHYIEMNDAVQEERYRRIEVLTTFLSQFHFHEFGPVVSRGFPSDEYDWANLVSAICQYWDIPAFRFTNLDGLRPGPKKKWTDRKLCELFADVQTLVGPRLSENGACAYIARNTKLFGPRYRRPDRSSEAGWKRTLHRQYLNAKSRLKNDPVFRAKHFSRGTSAAPSKYGPRLVAEAIQRYARKGTKHALGQKQLARN
jgi:hypothetical protein